MIYYTEIACFFVQDLEVRIFLYLNVTVTERPDKLLPADGFVEKDTSCKPTIPLSKCVVCETEFKEYLLLFVICVTLQGKCLHLLR